MRCVNITEIHYTTTWCRTSGRATSTQLIIALWLWTTTGVLRYTYRCFRTLAHAVVVFNTPALVLRHLGVLVADVGGCAHHADGSAHLLRVPAVFRVAS